MVDFERYFLDLPVVLQKTFEISDRDWIENILSELEDICNSTNFVPQLFDQNGRFGLIVYGEYKGEESVLKILPHNRKSKNEMIFWKENKYSAMLPIRYYNSESYYYIMPKGRGLPSVTGIEKKFDIVRPVFEEVFNQYNAKSKQVLDYKDKLEERYQIVKSNSFAKKMLGIAIEKYKKLDSMFETELLHGDLRYSNIVMWHNKKHIIDPLGVNAPKIMECTRYIEDDIFTAESFADFRNRVLILLNLFGNVGINVTHMIDAIFIDSVLRTTSSILLGENKQIINRGKWNAVWLLELAETRNTKIERR